MEIGYARVSRGDSQDLDPQLRALTDAGYAMIYQEKASGGHWRGCVAIDLCRGTPSRDYIDSR